MNDIRKFDDPLKFRPDYEWPEKGSERDCPKCGTGMQLVENRPEYFGKPWWCHKCKWQFSEDDLISGE